MPDLSKVRGALMALSRIQDPQFWRWVDGLLSMDAPREVVMAAPWDEIFSRVDFECFFLGAAWINFIVPGQLHPPGGLVMQALDMLPKTGRDKPVRALSRWWSAPGSAPGYVGITSTIVPCPILKRDHLDMFIAGARCRSEKLLVTPTSLWDWGLSIVLSCMAEEPDPRQLERLVSIAGRASKKGKEYSLYIRSLGGSAGWNSGLFAKGKPKGGALLRLRLLAEKGILTSSWVREPYRYYATRAMPGNVWGMVQRISLGAIKDLIRERPSHKTDMAWLTRLWSGYSILHQEDDEIFSLLPAILDSQWAMTVTDLLDRRSLVEKIAANPPKSLHHLPMIQIRRDPTASF